VRRTVSVFTTRDEMAMMIRPPTTVPATAPRDAAHLVRVSALFFAVIASAATLLVLTVLALQSVAHTARLDGGPDPASGDRMSAQRVSLAPAAPPGPPSASSR